MSDDETASQVSDRSGRSARIAVDVASHGRGFPA
jgi:hypothetical protein